MQEQLQKDSQPNQETGREALLEVTLPLLVALAFSFACAFMPFSFLAALLVLLISVGVIVALTHHTKS